MAKIGGNDRSRTPKDPPRVRAKRYAEIKAAHPELPDRHAAIQAGYSPLTSTDHINKTPVVQAAVESIAAQRARLQAQAGLTIGDVCAGLTHIAQHADDTPAAQVNAYRAISDILGYKAPEQIEVRQAGLSIELSGMSDEDIKRLINNLG
jgi:hypothetical protein